MAHIKKKIFREKKDKSHKFGVPKVTLISNQLATNLGAPQTSSGLIILELRKHYIYCYIRAKGQKLESAKGRASCIGVSFLKGLQMWSFGHSQGCITSWYWSVTVLKGYCQPGKLNWASVSREFLRVSLQRPVWLNHWPCTFFSTPLWNRDQTVIMELGLMTYSSKPQPFNHTVDLFGWPAPSLSHFIIINY